MAINEHKKYAEDAFNQVLDAQLLFLVNMCTDLSVPNGLPLANMCAGLAIGYAAMLRKVLDTVGGNSSVPAEAKEQIINASLRIATGEMRDDDIRPFFNGFQGGHVSQE